MARIFSKSIAASPGYFNDSCSKSIANSLSTLSSEAMSGILPLSGNQQLIIFIRNENKLLGDIVNMRLGTPKWNARASILRRAAFAASSVCDILLVVAWTDLRKVEIGPLLSSV